MTVCFFDSWDVVDHVWCARVNRNSCDFSVKAVNALVPSRRMKTVILPTRNLHFRVSSKPPTNWFSQFFSRHHLLHHHHHHHHHHHQLFHLLDQHGGMNERIAHFIKNTCVEAQENIA